MGKDLKSMVSWIVLNAKSKIKELATTELSNNDKKSKLDDYIKDVLEVNYDYYMPNGILAKFCYKYVIKKMVLPHISDFTQIIYDLLKSKIVGVTK